MNPTQGIKTYQPKLSVKLWRVSKYYGGVSRRYDGVQNPIDLTPYIGDFGYVSTAKDIRQDVGGFAIVFSNKADPRIQDSVYSLIAPMDYVEIRMAHDSSKYPSGDLPIIMRGFVNDIGIDQRMDDNGRPLRLVTVRGQDYGKLLGQMLIYYGEQYELGTDLLTTFPLQENHGIEFSSYAASAFVQTVLDAVVTPNLNKMWHSSMLSGAQSNPWHMSLLSSVQEGTVLPGNMQQFQGSVWQLLRRYSDQYWNELFIRDDDDGVHMIYRPLPYKDIEGNFINGAADPGSSSITLADVVSVQLSRSDKDVGNYFYVLVPATMLMPEGVAKTIAYSQGGYYLTGDAAHNCNPELYGIRKMVVNTVQGASGMTNWGRDLPEKEQNEANSLTGNWMSERRQELINLNKDNVLWESGIMRVKGNESLRVGTYLNLDYGNYTGNYYLAAVNHQFTPFNSYVTDLGIIRGNGYIVRTAAPKSPAYAETSQGAGV